MSFNKHMKAVFCILLIVKGYYARYVKAVINNTYDIFPTLTASL